MKKLFFSFIILAILFSSCNSVRTFSNFYDSHKNDMHATSFQMPRFMSNVLSGMSPEINSLFTNLNDFKFITLENVDSIKLGEINTEINLITSRNYIDIIRQNKEASRLIIVSKENVGIVKELIYYKQTNNNIHAFYLKGNFDSNKVKSLTEKGEFSDFTTKLLLEKPTIEPIKIQ